MDKGLAIGAASYLAWLALDKKLNLSSDIETASRLVGLKREIAHHVKNGYNATMFWTDAWKRGNKKKCFIMLEEDGSSRSLTFNDVELESNRMAQFFLSQGLTRGDTVALFMENRPEFVISWLGMTKIGVKVALINTSIKEKGLIHCIKISGCKMVLFGAELGPLMQDVHEALSSEMPGLKLFSKDGTVAFCPSCDEQVKKCNTNRPSADLTKGIKMSDVFGYIYTSGTTGLPKAAVILHQKVFAFGALMGRSFAVEESDVIYTVLPLFHSAGGGLGIGMMMYKGCTVVLRKKFTAKLFFKDCKEHGVTVVQYIGELCRYLLNTPAGENDRKHKIRIAIGNGLRPEIWDQFQTRFNIPEIGEFYGATEGNAALVNHCRTKEAQGCVGKYGWLMLKIFKIKFARYDVLNDCLVRNAQTGLCEEPSLGEPGELLFPIVDSDPSTTFAGYEDPKATAKKILKNAFVQGDKYFMTGDLLSMDAQGYVRFVDRIGDTFRWKGENCSTTEVTEVLSSFPGVEEPNVYGVLIPNNQDGRAPMAGITLAEGVKELDLVNLVKHLKKHLPSYAVPLFIRILPKMETTATMKQTKGTLRQEGIDISKVQDDMYYLQDGKEFVKLTKEVYAKICTPSARF